MFCFSRFIIFLVSIFMLSAGFVVLDQKSATVHAAIFDTTPPVEAVGSAVASFQAIGTLRNQDPIDADALTAEYAGVLQELTQLVDTRFTLNLDGDLLAAIDEIRDNNEPKLAAQVIDKTLQRVFFLTVLDRIALVRSDFETKATADLSVMWETAAAAFTAISGTAARDNKVLTVDRQSIETGSNPGLDVQITESFERGKTALNKANLDEDKIAIGIEAQNIRLSLVRAYYIGVLREVEGIISNRNREVKEAQEKQKEGEVFYRIVEEFVTRDNSTGNALIKSQLVGDLADVVADEIVSEMSLGFIGRVTGELNANESSVSTDRERAMLVAEEALLYSNVLLPDLELRLGAVERANMVDALNNLKIASSDGDVSGASDARLSITDILANYKNELLLAEYNKASETSFIDASVLSFQAIGDLRKQSPIDTDAIAAEYAGELQQLAKLADQIFGLTLDSDIQNAISDLKNGNQPKLAVQVLDKTLQRVFALAMFDRITLVHNAFDSLSTDALNLEWDRAYASFLAIIGTMARDNKVLSPDRLSIESGSNPHLDSTITAAFINGQKALSKINTDDKASLAEAREVIFVSMVRGFFIGVLREVDGIIDNRDREIEEALEKQKEGEIFYRIVDTLVSIDNPIGNDIIRTQLTGDLANVNADQIVSEISKGIIGRINANLSVNESMVGTDQSRANVAATKAFHYAGIFIDDLELRLDALKRIKLENALQDLINAGDRDDTASAGEARQAISAIIAEYQNELI